MRSGSSLCAPLALCPIGTASAANGSRYEAMGRERGTWGGNSECSKWLKVWSNREGEGGGETMGAAGGSRCRATGRGEHGEGASTAESGSRYAAMGSGRRR